MKTGTADRGAKNPSKGLPIYLVTSAVGKVLALRRSSLLARRHTLKERY